MSEWQSHPGVPLRQHLQQVADSCRNLLQQKHLNLSLPPALVADMGYLMGALHDLGKATRYFQHYLRSDDHEVTGPKHHALLSAFLVKEVAEGWLAQFDLSEADRVALPYLAFVAVRRHHGSLTDFETELTNMDQRKRPVRDLPDQVAAIEAEQVQSLLDEMLAPLSIAYSWSTFVAAIEAETLPDDYADFYEDRWLDEIGFTGWPATDQARYYFLFHLWYGALLLSDKRDVILEEPVPLRPLPLDAVTRFRAAKGFDSPRSELNRLQNQAYFDGLAHLEEVFSPQQHLYAITLPTGLGKTITSLGIALALKQKLNLPDSRLIIAIPFTSIIDQNYQVYEEMFEAQSSDLLLKHHHLSEPIYKAGDDELAPSSSQFLIESWDSQMVVTTFVQLLESLFTSDKSKLLKLPQLTNAVVILDEVQSIPYQLWPLIRLGLRRMAELYQTYFIFMSATQPLIFEPGREIQELIPDHARFFRHALFNRTRLVNRIEPTRTLAEFVDEILDYAAQHSSTDLLVVLNTKAIARQCFEQLRDASDPDQEELFFLSTLITPFERKAIIRYLRQPKQARDKRRIVVSTQLIEAGVDLSAGAVFRALAPLDSVIQAAGRANRYAEQADPADVFLYQIEELKTATSMIYGPELIQKTRNVLRGLEVCPERDYLQLIEAYYREVSQQAEAVTNPTLDALRKLAFAQVGEFKLIEERNSESVFLQLNPEAKALWERYAALHQDESLSAWQRKQQFAAFKAAFYDYVINVPIRRDETAIAFDQEQTLGFYVSPLEAPSRFYRYHPTDWQQNVGYVNQSFYHD